MKTKMMIEDMRCELLKNPIGLDCLQPRLSWKLKSDRRGASQTAYQVLAASQKKLLEQGKADLWDSGKVETNQTTQVEYNGVRLQPRQRVFWTVRVWDEDNEPTAYSQESHWEMGLINSTDWHAKWIRAGLNGGRFTTVPVPFFRKTFQLEQPIKQARVYVTALGLYELQINGQRVGSDVFTPGWTDYRKHVQYQTYDITDLLKVGENVVGAILGDGWYAGHVGWFGRQRYGERPQVLVQMEAELEDGSWQEVLSDASWKLNFGPIVESDIMMGEGYDARLEMGGWSQTGFDETGWLPTEIAPAPQAHVQAQIGLPVRRIQEIKPISEPKCLAGWPNPTWIYDLGQNMVGWARLKIQGERGMTVKMRYAEVLNPDGTLYTTNLRSARATDYYTCKGGGEEVFEPHFTFHGFRYVEISGVLGVLTRDSITGIVLHSGLEQTGSFTCSDPLINRLQHNIEWGQRGNFLDVPTDCPQRDERLGWTGDAQVFVRTASFNFDVANFFTRYQQNLEDGQGIAGEIPMYAPNVDQIDVDGGPAWADAVVICPWTIYRVYGDSHILQTYYGSMQRFMTYLETSSRDFIRVYDGYPNFAGFGDWLSINAETPKELIGTAFFAYCAGLMAEIAAVLGKVEDQTKYQSLHDAVVEAFQKRYVTAAGLVAGQTQTAYVLALHFDLLPEELRKSAVDQLVADIERHGMHLSTGFVGAPYLPHVLTRFGRNDIAYKLLLQQSWPSWLYSVTRGATTIWERWDGWTEEKGFQDPGMNSFNHYAYGSIGAWLYAVTAGIDIDAETTKTHQFILHPQPGGGLTSARAVYQSVYGDVVSGWQIEDDTFRLKVSLPANTCARVVLPARDRESLLEEGGFEGAVLVGWSNGEAIYQIQSGEYQFTSRR